MWHGLMGVRADRGYSYRKLEKVAAYVRHRLDYSPTEAINTLLLFDGLNIKVQDRTGRDIPIHGSVIELNGSEGFAKYDGDRRVIEILASPETYDWLEKGHPRGGFFVAHELGHCLLHTDQLVRLAQMPKSQQAALHRGGQEVAPLSSAGYRLVRLAQMPKSQQAALHRGGQALPRQHTQLYLRQRSLPGHRVAGQRIRRRPADARPWTRDP